MINEAGGGRRAPKPFRYLLLAAMVGRRKRVEGDLMTIVLAVCCAAIAALCFVGAATLQHGAVRVCTAEQKLGLQAFLQMMRSRRWQAGTGLAVTGSGLHVTALSQAPLVIVQPIGVLSLVLSVVLGSRISGISTAPGVRMAVTAACAGTAGFVALAAIAGPTASGPQHLAPIMLIVAGAVALTVSGLSVRGRSRCLMVATGAALLFGTGSAVIRMATLAFSDSTATGLGLAGLATVLMLTGGWAQHQAYASGPPALVIATTTVIDPLTAVAIGIGIYGEAPNTAPTTMAVQLALALIASSAVIALARAVPREVHA